MPRLRYLLGPVVAAAAILLLQMAGPPARGAAAPLGPVVPVPAHADGGTEGDVTQGALRVTRGGQVVECPLRHTDVKAGVSGFIARVRVTQTFENPYDDTIEAVYVFPLPHGSAVDEMTMVVGERRIAGVVKRRLEAREVYEQAIAAGQTAALLEQERPNIFTQSVGNIPPHQQVQVEIAYVDVLPYDSGQYEFHFPMVVGPRYIPGTATGHQGTGWAPDTTRVPDASRITPPVLKPGFRTGHDVSLAVTIDAGVPIRELRVHNHDADVERPGKSRAAVTLSAHDSIPNKDFVLSYHVAGERPQTALLSHAVPGDDGYFLLMVQPRELDAALRSSPPRDVCFLIDVSGSMSGEPIAKVSEAMERFFQLMRPQDRLQVVTFAGDATRLFPRYMPSTPENVAQALKLTREMRGGGGTEMLQGIRTVLSDPVDPERVRIVVMLTDGYIGNEAEIIGEVGRRAGDQLRFWTVGIGSSPNRFLLDGVARQGGGASAVVGLNDDPAPLVGSIMERIQRAQLSRIQIDWGGLEVFDTYPAQIGELWAGKPVFLLGRYRGAGDAQLTLSGMAEGEPVSFEVPVSLAPATAQDGAHAVLAAAWARKKIEHLGDQMAVVGESEELVDEVTDLALHYKLMSAYTSFVAVDESQAASYGAPPPRRMVVPVPMPDGVSYEGVFGRGEAFLEAKEEVDALGYVAANAAPKKSLDGRRLRKMRADAPALQASAPLPASIGAGGALSAPVGIEGGVAGGVVGGVPGGVVGGVPATLPARPAPEAAQLMMADERETRAQSPAEAEKVAQMRSQVDAQRKRTEAARAAAEAERKAGDLDAAARNLTLASALEQGRIRLTGYDDGTLRTVTAELDRVNAAREQHAVKALLVLGRPLTLVLRNVDLASALQQVASAAGVAVDVSAGSLADVTAAFGAPAARIAYLDLRGVTAARAFTWIAQPAGLVWTVREGRVSVATARRTSGAWVYEVPAATADAARTLPGSLRGAARAADPTADVVALTPGLLLVNGTARAHERVAAVLAGARVPGDATQKRRAGRETLRARAAVAAWTWRLLAAAVEGRVDEEAASELLEAWSVPGVAAPDTLTLRSLWAVVSARRAGPADPTLARLAGLVTEAARGALTARPALAGEAAVYASLIQSGAPGTLPAVPAEPGAYAPVARLVSAALPDAAAAQAVVTALSTRALSGDDALVLSAMGVRRAGAGEWSRFRERTADLARTAGASGAALQVVNHMDNARGL